VLFAVGPRFDDRLIGNVKHFGSVPRKIIHIDIDPRVNFQARAGLMCRWWATWRMLLKEMPGTVEGEQAQDGCGGDCAMVEAD